MNKVGIIGAGNIGCALARGLVNHGQLKPQEVYLSRKKRELLSGFETQGFTVMDNETLVRDCRTIILAVLPGQAREVLSALGSLLGEGNKILISLVAAVSIQEIHQWTGQAVPVARVMPNTAAEFGASMTCIAGEDVTAIARAEEIFRPLGQTMVIKEQLMPAATILAACGIAFFLRVIRAASQGGIQIGFHAEEAGMIAAQTARGAAELLMNTGHHPETEIDRVTTPMGCTISGLNEMEHFGLSSAMIRGIVKSFSGISDLK
jgi:pyrroline-5-carboxylate reductase